MSKLSSSNKNSPLPTQSAWARGPPQSSAAPSPTHSRKPSNAFAKDAAPVSVRAGAAPSRPVSQVMFGSIDDSSAPPAGPSNGPASPAPILTSNVKSFGSIPVTPASAVGPSVATGSMPPTTSSNGASKTPSTSSTAASTRAPSTPGTPAQTPAKATISKMDISKLFRGSATSNAMSPSSPTTKVPSGLNLNGPPQQQQQQPPSGLPGSGFSPYNAPHLRGPNSQVPPRSPQYQRAMTNGAPGPRPPMPNSISSAMSSPRIPPAQIPQQPPQPGMPPQNMPQPGMPGTPPMWVPQPGAYYMPPPQYPYYYQMPPTGDPNQPGAPPTWGQPPGPPIPGHIGQPHPGQMGSPRPIPPPLAVGAPPPPLNGGPQQHQMPQAPPSIPSAAPTPAAAAPIPLPNPSPSVPGTPSLNARTIPGGAGPGLTPMSPQAAAFVPRAPPSSRGIRITNPSGVPVLLPHKPETPTATTPVAPLPTPTVAASAPVFEPKHDRTRSAIRIESPADKAKREEAEKKKKEEEERVAKEKAEVERKKKEEIERAAKEQEEKERKAKEEVERIAKEKEEAERKAKAAAAEEAARKQKLEEEERLTKARKAEEERLAKEQAEVARKTKEREEAERVAKEKEAAAVAEAERLAKEKETAASTVPDKDAPTPVPTVEEPAADAPTPGKPNVPQLSIKTSDPRRRPGPINIDAARAPMTPGPMSALATARIITDINQIAYPSGIASPRVELNMGAKEGKFRYDRDFLMQFMEVCKEKPDHLPPPETLGLEPLGAGELRSGGGGGRGRGQMGPPTVIRRDTSGSGGFQPSGIVKSKMDTFAPQRPSQMGPVPFPNAGPGNRPAMTRTPSQGGPGGQGRTRSQRGNKRDSKLSNAGPMNHQSNAMNPPGMEPVAPLEKSENAWNPLSRRGAAAAQQNVEGPEVVERKVKSLLNKLTLERFDTISDQIIEWANRSEKEKDGRTLIQVIRLVFEKATDEANWSHMYARLCRKMMEQISPGVMDEGIRNNEGQPITGGHLFRKYLLNRCQEDFERGWRDQAEAAAKAAEKAAQDDEAKKAAGDSEGNFSEEYYTNQKAKRQGLGLVRFIGELFKLQMLTERIMHECIKKLLSNVDNPGEEEIESICKLLATVGQSLDTTKARSHMDIYFRRMKDLSDSGNIDSRMRFMLQDVIELRSRSWIPRNAVAAPTTIAAVHDQAAKDAATKERETASRMSTVSRGGSRRGDNRSEYGSQVGADGWSTPAGRPPSTKVGDLSQFGKIAKTAPGVVSLGPSSVFAGKKGGVDKRDPPSLSRASSSNPFAALTENPGAGAADAPSPSRSRKPSVDFSSAGSDAGGMRRKLQLLPRSKPLEEVKADDKNETPEDSEEEIVSPEQEAAPAKKSMTDDEVKKQVEGDTKEFFNLRKLDEGEQYFASLPDDQRYKMVESVFGKALEGKDAEATLVGSLFAKVIDMGKLSNEDVEKGCAGIIEFLDDMSVDVPAAYSLAAKVLFLAKLDEAAVGRLADKIVVDGDPLVAPRDKLLKEFQKLSS